MGNRRPRILQMCIAQLYSLAQILLLVYAIHSRSFAVCLQLVKLYIFITHNNAIQFAIKQKIESFYIQIKPNRTFEIQFEFHAT